MKTYDEMIEKAAHNLARLAVGNPDSNASKQREAKCDGYEMAIAEIFELDRDAVSLAVFDRAEEIVSASDDRRSKNRWNKYWNR
jgi:hypothetical protein